MMLFALAVFAVVLFVFAVDLVHRTPAALAGGILLVIVGAIGQEEAIEAVHWETLGVLVGVMTLVGDPPNIIIGTVVEELTFMDFIVNLAPPIIVILLVTLGLVWLVHGRKLHTSEEDRKGIMALQAAEEIEDRTLLVRAGAVCGATVIGFFLQQVTGLNPAIVALAGAAVAMLICGPEVEKVLHEVEWPTILFFVGLFVMVGALEAPGFIEMVAHSLASASDSLAGTAMIVMWGSGIASGIVDNIPFTATMIPVVEGLAEARGYDAATTEPLWWSLSLGACLGGNFTLIGASANLVVAGLVAREGMTTFTFLRFMLWGFPLTLVALVISSAYILLFQL